MEKNANMETTTVLVGRGMRPLVVIAFGLLASATVSPAQSLKAPSQVFEEKAFSSPATPDFPTADGIITRMLEHNRLRNEQLQRFSAIRTYAIKNLEGKLAAQAVVRVDYQAPDKKAFKKTSEKGSGIVRHLVFDRLIQSESETSSGREHRDSAITPANYKFTLIGEDDIGAYHCFVLEAVPKHNEKYLFEGKIWIDAEDFAIVRISGHPAKKPSFWINRADFVRQYQKIDGFWLPLRDETSVDVKLYGRRVFTIDHEQYLINRSDPLAARTGNEGEPDGRYR